MGRSARDLRRAADQLAVGSFLMTAEHEAKRAGLLVTSAQKCADEPLLICVAARKGHVIETLIRDSRHFGLCRLAPEDRTTLRRFEVQTSERDDPFDALGVEHLASGAPVLRRSTLVLDCEVWRHMDMEADHELYVGLVLAARIGPA